MSQLKVLGRSFQICLEICQALEQRNLKTSYDLMIKRKIYHQIDNDDELFIAKMQEEVFNHMSTGSYSWIEHFLYLKKTTFDSELSQAESLCHDSQRLSFGSTFI
jgi:hypothetical protein